MALLMRAIRVRLVKADSEEIGGPLEKAGSSAKASGSSGQAGSPKQALSEAKRAPFGGGGRVRGAGSDGEGGPEGEGGGESDQRTVVPQGALTETEGKVLKVRTCGDLTNETLGEFGRRLDLQ